MSLKSRLAEDRVLVAPGVYDALTASLATDAGFEALYLSGAAIAYTRLGRTDIGLVAIKDCSPTDDTPSLDDANGQSRRSQIAGTRQAVMTGTNDQNIERLVHRPMVAGAGK